MADIVELILADHQWLRRYFFYLDDARTETELAAVWEPLATRLDTHAQAEETVFYPALLRKGKAGDPEDETEDAIKDHNKIREAVAESRQHPIGTEAWYEAVGHAREENGEHLDEEERDAIPDFIKSAGADLRHTLAMKWLEFYHAHPAGRGVDPSPRDVEEYIDQNS
jgi:hypothetical protein